MAAPFHSELDGAVIRETNKPNRRIDLLIKNVPTNIETEEITAAIQDHYNIRVYSTYRLTKKQPNADGYREPLNIVKITIDKKYEEKFSREGIYIFYNRHQVYLAPPRARVIQCLKCQRFGHTTAQCRSPTTRCSKCGGQHKGEDCLQDETLCVNCGSTEHDTNSRDCPKYQLALAAVKSNIHRTYASTVLEGMRGRNKPRQQPNNSDGARHPPSNYHPGRQHQHSESEPYPELRAAPRLYSQPLPQRSPRRDRVNRKTQVTSTPLSQGEGETVSDIIALTPDLRPHPAPPTRLQPHEPRGQPCGGSVAGELRRLSKYLINIPVHTFHGGDVLEQVLRLLRVLMNVLVPSLEQSTTGHSEPVSNEPTPHWDP
jgi:hypothetical protein